MAELLSNAVMTLCVAALANGKWVHLKLNLFERVYKENMNLLRFLLLAESLLLEELRLLLGYKSRSSLGSLNALIKQHETIKFAIKSKLLLIRKLPRRQLS